jgi:SAM-dependent methyltransferase
MTDSDQPAAQREPGSFRDPESRVFYAGSHVYRALSSQGLADFEAAAAANLLEDPRIVRSERVDRSAEPDLLSAGVAAVLEHERIPFISYPYEWTFSMLRDAALLQLDLLLAAVEHDLILKDSTPYNIQYRGSRPVFIDVGSFERLRDGELWVGYRQFCMLYLYPLMLQATKGVSFQPWLRGSLDGITPAQMRAVMSTRDRFRRGYLTTVFLQARLDSRDGAPDRAVTTELKRPGLAKQLIVANLRKMHKLVSRLEWDPPKGVWLTYGVHNTYSLEDADRKDAFVRDVVASSRWQLAWDLGCNNGRHSRIMAERIPTVVAIDADAGPVELLYRDLRAAGDERILPLTMNLADPSPALGWRGLERAPLIGRGKPDLVLALALVHHLAIAANIPLREVVDSLAGLGSALLVEFPTRDDPMVQKLLAGKRPGLHADYDRSHFESCLSAALEIRRTEVLDSGTRVLYFAVPRGR